MKTKYRKSKRQKPASRPFTLQDKKKLQKSNTRCETSVQHTKTDMQPGVHHQAKQMGNTGVSKTPINDVEPMVQGKQTKGILVLRTKNK